MVMLKQQEVLLDTGPLLQVLVGLYDPRKLNKLGISPDDFGLLLSFVQPFRKKLVTPHVLAELSNLAKTRLKEDFGELIKFSIWFLSRTNEEIVPKETIIKEENLKLLMDFGITDTAISLAANKDRLILTNDGPFFAYCSNKKMPVLHTDAIFNKSI